MAATEKSKSEINSKRQLDAEDLAKIREGIEAADRGDFATEEEVRAEFARWRELGQRRDSRRSRRART